jgi:hypothetical protein
VKITVIATGFKPETMRSLRRLESLNSQQNVQPPAQEYAPPMHTAAPRETPRENVIWQGITPASSGGNQQPVRHDDLDVPAFLRMKG